MVLMKSGVIAANEPDRSALVRHGIAAFMDNLRSLADCVDAAAGDFVRFVFKSGHIIALDRRLCLKHDPDTLAMNAIPSRCSADLEDPERPSAAWCGSLFLRAMRS